MCSPTLTIDMGAQFQHSPGQLVNLLRVAVTDEVDMGTRQAAAISFKNLVRKDWEGTGVRSRGCLAHALGHGCAFLCHYRPVLASCACCETILVLSSPSISR